MLAREGRVSGGYKGIAVIAVLAFAFVFLVLASTGNAANPGRFAPQTPQTPFPARFTPQSPVPPFTPPPVEIDPQPARRAPERAVGLSDFFPDVPRQDVYRLRCTPRLNPHCSGQFTFSDLRVGTGMFELQETIDNCNALGVQPYKSNAYIETAFEKQRRADPMAGFVVATGNNGMFIHCTAQLRITSAPTVEYDSVTHTAVVSWETSVNANYTVEYGIPDERILTGTVRDVSADSKAHEATLTSLRDGNLYQVNIQTCSVIPTVQCVSDIVSFSASTSDVLSVDIRSPSSGQVIPYNEQPITLQAVVTSSETTARTTVSVNGVDYTQMCSDGEPCLFELPTLVPNSYIARVITQNADGSRTAEDSVAFTITKMQPLLTFTLNDWPSDLTIFEGDTVTASASISPALPLVLLLDGREVARDSSGSVSYSTSFAAAGSHNFVARFDGNALYQEASLTRSVTVNVRDRDMPTANFIAPTPADGAMLAEDSATIRIETSEAVTATLIHSTPEMASPDELTMNRIDDTHYEYSFPALAGGLHSYSVRLVDRASNTALTASRTFNVPSSFLLYTFDGVGIGTISTFRVGGSDKLFVGTFRESTPGQGGVWMSEDQGRTWTQVFRADRTPTMTGVYASAVAMEAGVPTLYVGVGGTTFNDGQVWKTTNGRDWVRADTFFRWETKVNQLKVIDGSLFAASSTHEDAGDFGSVCYNFNSPPMLCYGFGFGAPATSVEKYNSKLYVVTSNAQVFERANLFGVALFGDPVADLSAEVVSGQRNRLQTFNGKLYLGVGTARGGLVLRNSRDARTWVGEAMSPNVAQVPELNILSDSQLHVSTAGSTAGGVYKRNLAETNTLEAEFPPLRWTMGIVEIGGRKYAVANDRGLSTASMAQLYLVSG